MFTLKKLAEKFLSPVGLTVALLIYIALRNHNKGCGSRVAALLGLCILLPPSLPPIADALIGRLERFSAESKLDAHQVASAIVVLGGTVLPQWSEQFLAEEVAGSRLLTALRLYKLGKAPKIVVSSGISYEAQGGILRTEAEDMRDILIIMGVPEPDIILERRSLDTSGNAKFTAEALLPATSDILLVTSAYHLERATLWFQKVGFRVQPVGAGYSTRAVNRGLPSYLPSAAALNRSSQAIKEYFALALMDLGS